MVPLRLISPMRSGEVDESLPAVTARALVAFGDEQREPFGRVAIDLGELDARSCRSGSTPAKPRRKTVDLPDDLLDRHAAAGGGP